MTQFQSFQPTCAITNSKVYLGRTVTGTGELQTTDILVYDRDNPESDPPVLTSYNVGRPRTTLKIDSVFYVPSMLRMQQKFTFTVTITPYSFWRDEQWKT